MRLEMHSLYKSHTSVIPPVISSVIYLLTRITSLNFLSISYDDEAQNIGAKRGHNQEEKGGLDENFR